MLRIFAIASLTLLSVSHSSAFAASPGCERAISHAIKTGQDLATTIEQNGPGIAYYQENNNSDGVKNLRQAEHSARRALKAAKQKAFELCN